VGFVLDKIALEQVFSPNASVSLSILNLQTALHSSSLSSPTNRSWYVH
jgi:hypothetical protein